MKVYLINCRLESGPFLNLGMAYIATVLSSRHQVKILDFDIYLNKRYKSYVRNEIINSIPDIVGFSVNSFNLIYALDISREIKRINSSIHVVFGGVHPTLLPEETLKYPEVDAVCIGEGEVSFQEYINKIEEGEDYIHTKGMWVKNDKGDIIKNELRPFIENLDMLPFPNRNVFDLEFYIRKNLFYSICALPFLSSRGCMYKCNFCSAPIISKLIPGRYFRVRSVENVIEEIEIEFKKNWKKGFRCVAFMDDIFGWDFNWLEKFCNIFKKKKLNKWLSWICHTRADILNEDWIKVASEAGCVMVGIGVETGDEEIRRRIYNKNISNKHIERIVDCLKRFNIVPSIYFIFGDSWENRTSIDRTVTMANKFTDSVNHFFNFLFLPKTSLSRTFHKEFIKENILQNLKRYYRPMGKYPGLNAKTLMIQRRYLAKEILISIKSKKFLFIIEFIKLFCYLFIHHCSVSYRYIKHYLHWFYIKCLMEKNIKNRNQRNGQENNYFSTCL